MIKSMTGYGAGQAETDAYQVNVEIKAVNQRFLELDFRMSHRLNRWENRLRQTVKAKVARGKLDIRVSFSDKREQGVQIKVNHNLAKAYGKALHELGDVVSPIGKIALDKGKLLLHLAAVPDVITVEESGDLSGADEVLISALGNALADLNAMRCREGEHIRQDFAARLTKLEQITEELTELAPVIVTAYRERLQKTIADILGDKQPDETRLLQETAIFADKSNYTEEIVRLGSHFRQFRTIMDEASEPVGRKLDFLIQEMNREANTIGSKAGDAKGATLTVELKAELEKLREQVQNIE
ncbi:MAG: YicC family protein [Selenomonadaceae bacterium]|nr:YicC family protein [Selenomonadaceae bacterium]